MKNTKLFGRIVCLILAVVMCLSLAACGSSGQSGTANTKKDQEPTPEYVYTAEYKDLTQNRENYLNICAMTADGMYATSNEKIGENIPEGVTPSMKVSTMFTPPSFTASTITAILRSSTSTNPCPARRTIRTARTLLPAAI